jgi:ABC-2 type transport system permease protein
MASADVSMQPDYVSHVERLPTHEREGQLFWKLRIRESRSQLRNLFTNSRMRTSLVISLSVFFWAGLFSMFYLGFSFVVSNVGMPGATYHAQTVQFVFTLFFMSLQVMLIFSAGIILYGGLYSSNETTLLLTLPVRDSRLVYYRFQEALFFSSWGFFLLASPMMISYGLVVKAPWYYYAYLPGLMISFAYIPCALGAIACLLIVSRVPHLRRIIVGAVAIVVVAIAYTSIWNTLDIDNADLLGTAWFKQTFRRFEFTRGEWLPSTWLSNGLLDSARRQSEDLRDLPWLQSGKSLFVLVSNALFFHIVLLWVGGLVYRDSYHGLNARQAREAQAGMAWLDRLIEKSMFFLPRDTQLLVMKDIRLFRRDPVQWSQFIIFFGLLMLYFANVDRFRQHRADVSSMTWVNIVSFLNLAVVGLILSTFTTRFIYPLISLEGRRFWILGRLPIERDTILWGKFLFAACGSWLPCAALVFASDILLDVSLLVMIVHQFISVLLCLGLSGMAVGLGAMMPDFREQSPSKIAAGFGGTLNLVLSAIYILLVVLMTALPCHFYLLSSDSDLQSQIGQPQNLKLWVGLGLAGVFILAALVTSIPLWSGLKAFRNLEV